MADPGPDPLAEIRNSFFVECEELLESLQDALTDLQAGSSDPETINTAFRAVHSIKGGAGAFALEELVGFAHRFESVMDTLRSGAGVAGETDTAALFRAADMLADLVRAARDGLPAPPGREAILAELERQSASAPPREAGFPTGLPSSPSERPVFVPVKLDIAGLAPAGHQPDQSGNGTGAPGSGTAQSPPGVWTIRLRPHDALFETGNDVVHVLRVLQSLGPSVIRCDTSGLPEFDDLRLLESHLSWTVELEGNVPEADILDTFEFIEGLCEISIRSGRTSPGAVSSGPDQDDPGTNPVDPGDARDGADPGRSGVTPGAERPAPPASPTITFSDRHQSLSAGGVSAISDAATVRVALERIDRLVNQVGELVINQAMLAQSMAEAGIGSGSPVAAGIDALSVLIRDIQDSVMMIRAQPVKPLFQRAARILRESAASVGKEIRLVTEGEATEIDKTVIERLADPLTHMIRNAVDHGIEDAVTRRACGKTDQGTIRLSARHRSGRVLIEVADDGRGIDRAAVLRKAEERGLVAADAGLTESEIDNLIFLPGFSTAATVSNLSGRGVGMDVVRRAIAAMGGRISIATELGAGTTFTISLPLTLAVMDGMVITAGGETLVLPLSCIVETAIISRRDLAWIGAGSVLVRLRDAYVPVIDLGSALGLASPKDGLAGATAILVADEDGSRAALVVDRINEQRQIVIKGLGGAIGGMPGVAAATILGDGRVALILDPAELIGRRTQTTEAEALLKAG
ncbi:MAG: chemotaxis protein CheA [Rhodobacteraceae bacterium]|nr:chemotaxis protein CheA [Paracoccaceae bacterium]